MRRIDRWQADDGSIWADEAGALERDALIVACAAEEKRLELRDRPRVPGCRFENGEGYVQQPRGSRLALQAFATAHHWNRDTDGPIGRIAYRIYCLDDHDREWGQPYFAMNSDKVKRREDVGGEA